MTDAVLNLPADQLPAHCDVLVIGAGPAGSACARWLARAGRDVVLVDAQCFPREKTCGDGLVPDSLAALARLGLKERVLAEAQAVALAHCVGPRGGAVDVPGEMAVLPRKRLDELLCAAAVEAGARMFAPLRFVATIEDDGRVVGARFAVGPGGGAGEREIRATAVVVATGAASGPLQTAGVCERRSPSSIALRGYARLSGVERELAGLHFVWHPRIRQGYGWIFPAGDGVYNIGVAILDSHNVEDGDGRRSMKNLNLRELFAEFCAVYPLARRLRDEGQWLTELKGAPLRCNLDGAAFSRPGLFVAGEAAGTTYAFTGEGIGKAMETGIAAAEALLETVPEARQRALYAAKLEALRPRFVMYRKATSFNRWPWLVDLVIWRSRRSPRLIRAMSAILNETRMPGSVLSWRGLKRLVLG